jgi:hypothetical protein
MFRMTGVHSTEFEDHINNRLRGAVLAKAGWQTEQVSLKQKSTPRR